jgi:hypothetical protein
MNIKNGNVGIGVENPTAKLEVAGSQIKLDGGTSNLYSYTLSGTNDSGIKKE